MRRALVALFFSACIPYAEPHAVVNEGFALDERASLERAAAKWNAVVRDPVRLDGGDWKIIPQTPPAHYTKGFIGQVDRDKRIVYLMPGMDPTTFYAVALHELGHVVGLHHVSGDASVMNGTLTYATEFSREDLEECVAVGACDLPPGDQAKCRFQGACP